MFTILIVEDEVKIRSLIAAELQNWGYAVHVAEDFRHVEDTVLTVKPQLILLDINLPYMNGFIGVNGFGGIQMYQLSSYHPGQKRWI